MPYSLGDILNSKSVTYLPYDGKGFGGLKMNGVYSYVRHPLQCGLLSLLMFANGVYTVDKILHVIVMGAGIVIGVRMEEQRMLVQFKGYKEYMEEVKAKYIPYLHFIGL
jgi:protein-S-isoprenylcysteine O-methyltransferase Ste14